MKILFFCLAAFLTLQASASSAERTYGGEPTFTSPELKAVLEKQAQGWVGSDPAQSLALSKWAELIRKECLKCRVEAFKDDFGDRAFRVTTNSGLAFDLTSDNGVIEVRMAPLTLREALANQATLQTVLFDTGKSLNLLPDLKVGGGHIHIGLHEGFENNAALFREFLVDMMNHPDVVRNLGISGANSSVNSLSEVARANMFAIIAEFDRRLDKGERGGDLILWASREIEKKVYFENPNALSPAEKYQAINLRRVTSVTIPEDQRTVELRFFRPQRSALAWVGLVRLLDGRLDFLKARVAKGERAKLILPDRKSFTIEQRAMRLKTFAREAGVTALDVIDALRDEPTLNLVRNGLRCEQIFAR